MRGNAVALAAIAVLSVATARCGGRSNAAPVANAGADQSVVAGSSVMLDGSGSSDADRDTLTYSWSIATKPAGSTARLDYGGSAAFLAFTADVAGTYVLTLTVSDGKLSSPPDDVTIVAVVSAPVPDSYQVTSFTDSPGEDSDYWLHPSTYSNALTGTWADSVTQLTWLGWEDQTVRTWGESRACCAGLDFWGGGWRLPTPYELLTIGSYGISSPAIETNLFLGAQAAPYWTAADGPTASEARIVDFDVGGVTAVSTASSAHTRCVRGGPTGFVFHDDGDGTVTDQARQLTWQQADDGVTKTWEQALAYCEGLTLGGYADWRLPNVKELASILDFSRSPVADLAFFPTAKQGDYWSSTTVVAAPGTAWQASFRDGRVGLPGLEKTTAVAYVRCLRGQ